MGNKLRIHQPGDTDYVQTSLGFDTDDWLIKNKFPKVHRNLEGFRHVLNTYRPDFTSIGYDLEFNNSRPTIIGISNLEESASIKWDSRIAEEVVDVVTRRQGTLVAYSAFGADKPVTDSGIGRVTPLGLWDDAMELFYLLHQAFAKSGDRSEEEEDAGSLGFFNLWSCASIYTDLSQWKVCRGSDCPAAAGADYPCPRHNVWGYNGIDALAGAQAFYNMRRVLADRGVPWRLYTERLKLGFITNAMQTAGVNRDKPYMDDLQNNILDYKDKLFPKLYDDVSGKLIKVKGKVEYEEFNPSSPAQTIAWFKANGVSLKSSEKAVITKALEERARKMLKLTPRVDGNRQWTIYQELEHFDDEIDVITKRLWDLGAYKGAGKGTDAWLADRYFGNDGFLHPRFPTTGAQTTRLSSSKPNFQNVPARGWGAIFRGGIIPRDPKNYQWTKADNSQLELRSCLWQAGVNVREIVGDAFEWLVEKSNGGFDKASAILQQTPRQSAKSFAHGADYLEGFILLTGTEIESARRQSEIRAGALIVYLPKYGRETWEFRGKVVCFTGANVAERLFGSKTFENRKKALDLQEIYFNAFPQISAWHRKSLAAIENTSFVRYPSGHSLEVVGYDVDVAKAAIAALGQGVGAVYVMANLTRLWDETGEIPTLVVHDELDIEKPRGMSDEEIVDSFRFMSRPHDDLLPDFMAPATVYRGESWMEDSRDVPAELKDRCLRKIGKV